MNTELPSSCKCYGLYDDDNIIGFMGILHQPHAINKKIKRVSRLVILPDYQGIGLGTQFLDFVAEQYVKDNYDFSIITSAKNMIYALRKSNKWCMYRYSWVKNNESSKISKKTRDAYTAAFMYKRK